MSIDPVPTSTVILSVRQWPQLRKLHSLFRNFTKEDLFDLLDWHCTREESRRNPVSRFLLGVNLIPPVTLSKMKLGTRSLTRIPNKKQVDLVNLFKSGLEKGTLTLSLVISVPYVEPSLRFRDSLRKVGSRGLCQEKNEGMRTVRVQNFRSEFVLVTHSVTEVISSFLSSHSQPLVKRTCMRSW